MQELQQRFESTSENLRKNVVELESQRRDLLHLQVSAGNISFVCLGY